MSSAFFRNAFLSLLGLFLALPLMVVFGVSFNDSAQMIFPPQDVGLRWYRTFFDDPAWNMSFQRSIIVAICVSLLSTAVAMPIAYTIWRFNSRFARQLAGFGILPFLVPPIVIGILFLIFGAIIGHVGRIENIVVSHVVTFLAIPLTLITLGFREINREVIECAQTLGASDGYVFRSMIVPLISPYVVSGMIFAAIFSLNEVVIAFLVGGFVTQTLPVQIFVSLRTGFTPTMCVAAVLFFVIGVLGLLLIARLNNLPRLLGGRV